MKPWILAIIIVVGVYLLLIITNIIFVVSFYIIMKKHDKGINIILKSKFDNLKSLVSLLKEHEIIFDEEAELLLKEIDALLLKEFKVNECESIKKKLSYLSSLVYSKIEEREDIKKLDEFELLNDNITQLDSVYRSNVIMYNADVLGYNYWVRFLPCRYLWLLFRFKEKDLIS